MNAELTLGRVTNVESSPVKGLNPMALAMTIEGQLKKKRKSLLDLGIKIHLEQHLQ